MIVVGGGDPLLLWLEKLKELLPGKEFVLGAWQVDGFQYGTHLESLAVYDENGDIVTPEVIGGAAIYPVHAKILDIMPEGKLAQVHHKFGWADRRWV